MKNKKSLWIIILAAVAAVMLGVYFFAKPKPAAGAKAVVIEVRDKEGNEKSYSGNTDAEFLKDAMDDLSSAGFAYEASDSEYGLFVTSVNGVTADPADSAYWAVYVNGEYGQYGISEQPVADGDTFTFAYETY